MAHFAQLNDSNIVQTIVVIADEDCLDDSNNESEAVGIAFCKSLWGDDTIWKQTSYNSSMRYNFAAIGNTYDATADAFHGGAPFPSWSLSTETYKWEAPSTMPDDGNSYSWDEDTVQWIRINE